MNGEKSEEFKAHEKITSDFIAKEEAKTNEVEARDAAALKEKDSSFLTVEEKEKIKGFDKKEKETKEKKESDDKSALEKAEAKAKEDEKILDTPEDELDEKGKARKAEILKTRKEKEDNRSEEEKAKDKVEKEKKDNQTKLDKRFGDLTGQIKDLKKDKGADKEKIAILEKELSEVKDKLNPEKVNEAKNAEKARISKYLEEDKDKPRDQRREMSKEDLEEWLLEDTVEANEWMVERSLRRSAERGKLERDKQRDSLVGKLAEKINESAKRVDAKHPELDTKNKEEALKKEGKTDKEVHDIFYKDNEKYRIMFDISQEKNPKYMVENGPELMAEEMEKRLAGKDKTKEKGNKTYSAEEIEKIKKEAIDAEEERKNKIDEGNSSTHHKEGVSSTQYDADTEKKIAGILKKTGWNRKEFDEAVADRKVRVP